MYQALCGRFCNLERFHLILLYRKSSRQKSMISVLAMTNWKESENIEWNFV